MTTPGGIWRLHGAKTFRAASQQDCPEVPKRDGQVTEFGNPVKAILSHEEVERLEDAADDGR